MPIEVVAARPALDCRQSELPLLVELNLPPPKKVLAPAPRNVHALAPAHEHDHAHDLENRSTDHVHDHDELTPAQQDLLDQITELVASENRAAHFRTTWILRIHDYPNQVFAAIGEARAAKREGRVRKSVGGVLNWHFEKFREAAQRQRKAS